MNGGAGWRPRLRRRAGVTALPLPAVAFDAIARSAPAGLPKARRQG